MKQRLRPCVSWRSSIALLSCALWACGAEDDGAERLRLDPKALCSDATSGCFNVGAESFEVDGVPVIHKRIPGHPMVAMQVSIDTAALTGAEQWNELLALALMNAGGSFDLGRVEWPKRLVRLGAGISADGGGLDYSSISAQAPLPHWGDVWDLLQQAVKRPFMSDFYLDAVRENVLRNFEAEGDDPEAAADISAFTLLQHGQRYNQGRESRAEIEGLNVETLRQGWAALRDETRWLITFVGDLSRRDVERAVRALVDVARTDQTVVAPLSAAPPAATAASLEAGAMARAAGLASQDVALLDYPASPAWYIVSYFSGPEANASDYAALELALRVLDQRLFSEVRDVRGLTYSTGANLNFYRQTFGRFWLLTDRPLEALPVVRSVVAELRASGPSERELQTARNGLRQRILAGGSTVGGQASLLADWTMTAGSRQAVDDLLSSLDSITQEDVRAVLSYLDGAKTAAAGPGDELQADDLTGLLAAP